PHAGTTPTDAQNISRYLKSSTASTTKSSTKTKKAKKTTRPSRKKKEKHPPASSAANAKKPAHNTSRSANSSKTQPRCLNNFWDVFRFTGTRPKNTKNAFQPSKIKG